MAIYHHFVTAPYGVQSNFSAMLFFDNALLILHKYGHGKKTLVCYVKQRKIVFTIKKYIFDIIEGIILSIVRS
jgi:hypothetical protein